MKTLSNQKELETRNIIIDKKSYKDLINTTQII